MKLGRNKYDARMPSHILALRLNFIEKYTFVRGITELRANFGCDGRLSLIVEVIKISGSVIPAILLL